MHHYILPSMNTTGLAIWSMNILLYSGPWPHETDDGVDEYLSGGRCCCHGGVLGAALGPTPHGYGHLETGVALLQGHSAPESPVSDVIGRVERDHLTCGFVKACEGVHDVCAKIRVDIFYRELSRARPIHCPAAEVAHHHRWGLAVHHICNNKGRLMYCVHYCVAFTCTCSIHMYM